MQCCTVLGGRRGSMPEGADHFCAGASAEVARGSEADSEYEATVLRKKYAVRATRSVHLLQEPVFYMEDTSKSILITIGSYKFTLGC